MKERFYFKWLILFHRKYEQFFDCILPIVARRLLHEEEVENKRLQGLLDEDLNALSKLNAHSTDLVKSVYKELIEKSDEETNRLERVESKLATLFALSAISVTMVLSVNGLASLGAHWSIVAISGYSLLQIIRALLAVMKGLKRQSYFFSKISDLIPVWIGAEKDQIIPSMENFIRNLHHTREIVNKKVTQLEVAHIAFRNFLVGISLLFIFFVIYSSPKGPDSKKVVLDIISELEKKPNLLKVLQGPVGLQGPKGEIGNTGPAGKDCKEPEKKIPKANPTQKK